MGRHRYADQRRAAVLRRLLDTRDSVALTGQNIGDLLNARGLSWGWFEGGFAPTGPNPAGYAVCGSSHANVGGSGRQR